MDAVRPIGSQVVEENAIERYFDQRATRSNGVERTQQFQIKPHRENFTGRNVERRDRNRSFARWREILRLYKQREPANPLGPGISQRKRRMQRESQRNSAQGSRGVYSPYTLAMVTCPVSSST